MIHSDEKISQLGFIRDLVREYIQNKRPTELILPDISRLAPLSVNNHFTVLFTQGICKICKKNTTKACKDVTLDSMSNAFQHIISNLHDIKVVDLFYVGYRFIVSYTSCCYMI